jgi:uncharacterized phage protein (TIGR01671 family)
MREIKFRAWDGSTIGDVIAITMDEHVIVREPGGVGARSIPMSKCDLMQYTGLHDKDGKQIYEGDIVKGYGTYRPKEGVNAWEVYWDEQCASWWYRRSPNNVSYRGGLVSSSNEDTIVWGVAIIGNIYENPDLLK